MKRLCLRLFPSLDRLGLALTLLAALAITIASLAPKGSVGDPGEGDKTAHIAAYAVAIFPAAAANVAVKPIVAVALGVLAWSGTIELIQPLVGRSAHMVDFAANAVGIVVGYLIGLSVRRLARGSAQPPARRETQASQRHEGEMG